MKKTNKIIALVLAVISLLSVVCVVPVTASAKVTNVVSSSAKSPTSGKWGKNAKWKLSSKGVLTISGKGTLKIEELSESVARKVKEIKINDGITKVDFSALFFVNDARKVTLNKTITSIDRGVFNYFDNITSVNVPSGNKKYSSVAGVLYSKDKKKLIFYPRGKKGTKYTIPYGTKTIGKYAFDKSQYLKSVTIPSTVTSIEEGAFFRCEKIKKITIPSSVKRIGNLAYGFYVTYDEDLNIYIEPIKGCTIYGKAGSAAHRYSRNFGVKFKKN